MSNGLEPTEWLLTVPMTRVSHRRGMQSGHEPDTSVGTGGPNPLYTHD